MSKKRMKFEDRKFKQVSASIPGDVFRRVDGIADREQKSRSEVLTDLLRDAIARRERVEILDKLELGA